MAKRIKMPHHDAGTPGLGVLQHDMRMGRALLEYDERFMVEAYRLAARARGCTKRRVGAVCVDCDGGRPRIVGGGANRVVFNAAHDWDCPSCVRVAGAPAAVAATCPAIHAEADAIIHALCGSGTAGRHMYVTTRPCPECAKLIERMGTISVVYYVDSYPSPPGWDTYVRGYGHVQVRVPVPDLDMEIDRDFGGGR